MSQIVLRHSPQRHTAPRHSINAHQAPPRIEHRHHHVTASPPMDDRLTEHRTSNRAGIGTPEQAPGTGAHNREQADNSTFQD